MSGNWGWHSLILVMFLFNTVLGEELLRGLLLPRMNRVFGRGDCERRSICRVSPPRAVDDAGDAAL